MSVHYGSYGCCGANSIYCFYESPFTTENKRTLRNIKTSSHFHSCVLTEAQMVAGWYVNNVDPIGGIKTWRAVFQKNVVLSSPMFSVTGVEVILSITLSELVLLKLKECLATPKLNSLEYTSVIVYISNIIYIKPGR